jgi:hypothetical protein
MPIFDIQTHIDFYNMLVDDFDDYTHGWRSSAHAARRRAMSISARCRMCRRHACTISLGGWFVRSAKVRDATGCDAAPACAAPATFVFGSLSHSVDRLTRDARAH